MKSTPTTAELGQRCKDAAERVTEARHRYYAGQGTYEEMREAAIACLEARRTYERAKWGKVRTQVNNKSVADLLR